MRLLLLPPIIIPITSNERWNTETHKTDRYPPTTNHKPWPFEPVEVKFCFLRGPLRWCPFGGESLHWIFLKALYNGRLFTTVTFLCPQGESQNSWFHWIAWSCKNLKSNARERFKKKAVFLWVRFFGKIQIRISQSKSSSIGGTG